LNKPLYVVINKVDTKADSEVQKVENLIKKTLSDAGLQVQQFIKFSSKAPLTSIMNPIKAVNKITTRDTFVSDVRTDLEQLLGILDEAVKSSNQSYDNARQEGDEITDQFIECMKALQGDCETAYNIPQWVEHLFSKDRFEMSDSDGNHLKELLAQIADDRIQDLAQKFDERVDKAGEIQQEWSDLCDLKAAWQKANDCFEQFKKVSKNIE
jgi:translation elongation factor EF-G